MADREPKSTAEVFINVTGRTSSHRGRFRITSGNFHYWRSNAKGEDATVTLTMQQLISLLEKHAAHEALDADASVLPKSSGTDFAWHLGVISPNELGPESVGGGSCRWKSMSRVGFEEDGQFEVRADLKGPRGRVKFPLSTWVSIQGALWLVDTYIDRILEKYRHDSTTDKVAVVSKAKLKQVLETWLKRLGTPVARSTR